MFLACMVFMLWFGGRNRLGAASIMSTLGCLTRVAGVFTIPLLMFWSWNYPKKSKKSLALRIGAPLLPLLAAVCAQAYVKIVLGRPGYLGSDAPSSIQIAKVLPLSEYLSSLSRLIGDTAVWGDAGFMMTLGWTAIFLTIGFLSLNGIYKLRNSSLFIYQALYMLMLSCMSWLISGPRFMLAALPMFLLVARYRLFLLLLIPSVALQIYFLACFLRGKWAF
jgi:hypothetical protein